MDFFLILPEEILLGIFHYLSALDLARASMVDHRWHRLTNDPELWRDLLYPRRRELPSGLTWKELYIITRSKQKLWKTGRCVIRRLMEQVPGEYSVYAMSGNSTLLAHVANHCKIAISKWKEFEYNPKDTLCPVFRTHSSNSTIPMQDIMRPLRYPVQPVATLDPHDRTIWSLYMTETHLSTASDDATAAVYTISYSQCSPEQPARFKHVGRLETHTAAVQCVRHDCQRIYTSSWDGSAHVHDMGTLKLTAVCRAHSERVNALDYFQDSSQILFTGGADKHMRVWDLRMCGPAASEPVKTINVGGNIRAIKLIRNGSHVFNTSQSQVQVWDLRKLGDEATLIPLKSFDWHENTVYCMDADDYHVITGGWDSVVVAYDLEKLEPVCYVSDKTGYGSWVWSVHLSDDKLVSGAAAGVFVRIFMK